MTKIPELPSYSDVLDQLKGTAEVTEEAPDPVVHKNKLLDEFNKSVRGETL